MQKLKSHIDWNEVVPLLPKSKQDDLYLEAILLLTQGTPRRRRRSPTSPETIRELTHDSIRPGGIVRLWSDAHNGRGLAVAGNSFTINKDAPNPPTYGKIGELWRKLASSKNDAISFEGIASLCKGVELVHHSTIATLWSRKLIDLVEPSK
jgi:hypothetical protein